MISLNWEGMSGQVGELMKAYDDLPRHIAKKHLKAAMKRALKPGVPILKKNTPKQKTRITETGKVKGGALRRAVTTKAKYIGRNKDGVVVGVLGYKAGSESRKAIWMEFGTKSGVEPRRMVEKSMSAIGPAAAAALVVEMTKALDAAARDKAPGVAQAYRRK